MDWDKDYTSTTDHPHRLLIIKYLEQFAWGSLMEVGCASGPNLINILKRWPNRDVGGVDVNEDAIKVAKTHLPPHAFLMACPAHDIFMSDKSTDVTISDMTLIYVGPHMIKKTLDEIERITRQRVIFCDFHHPSWIKRSALKWATGYYAYDYEKMLEKRGWYDVRVQKIPEELWPGGEPQKTYGYIISAKLPMKKL